MPHYYISIFLFEAESANIAQLLRSVDPWLLHDLVLLLELYLVWPSG